MSGLVTNVHELQLFQQKGFHEKLLVFMKIASFHVTIAGFHFKTKDHLQGIVMPLFLCFSVKQIKGNSIDKQVPIAKLWKVIFQKKKKMSRQSQLVKNC